MFWRTFVRPTPSGSFYLSSIEFDWDGEVTDVDEPAASYGMDFPTREAAVAFAEAKGIRLAPDGHYPSTNIVWDLCG